MARGKDIIVNAGKRSIYISKENVKVFVEALGLSNLEFSETIVVALKEYIERHDILKDSNFVEHNIYKGEQMCRFIGKEIYKNDVYNVIVFFTAKENIIVYQKGETPSFEVYELHEIDEIYPEEIKDYIKDIIIKKNTIYLDV